MLTSVLIEFGLDRRQQWWPKRRPLSSVAATMWYEYELVNNILINNNLAHY